MLWFLNEPISGILAFAITAILAFAYHEFAHAIVADRLGDPTPREHGRITLNPFPHLSVFGLIMLFLVGFGWAVTPVNPNRLRGNYRRSMALVAIAGPCANLIMAILWALPLRLGLVEPSFAEIIPTPFQVLWAGVTINILLFAFNLIPIPPLDGFTILQGIVPPDLAYQLDALRQYGSFLLLGALFLLPAIGINIVGTVVGQVSNLLLPVLTGFA